MKRIIVFVVSAAFVCGCQFDPATNLVCKNNGERDGARVCEDGIWVTTEPTSDAGSDDVSDSTDVSCSESDAELCARLQKDCETLPSVVDKCGTPRDDVDCGVCSDNLTCGGLGIANVCGCPGVDPEQECQAVNAQCGTVTVNACNTDSEIPCGVCFENATCEPATNTCVCGDGFELADNCAGGDQCCEDIDECGDPTNCPAESLCVNEPGSYTCECPNGYTFNVGDLTCDRDNPIVSHVENLTGAFVDNEMMLELPPSVAFGDVNQVVPFVSNQTDDAPQCSHLLRASVSGGSVLLERDCNGGPMEVAVSAVEFDPAYVTVQSGLIDMPDDVFDETIPSVDEQRSFIVFYCSFSGNSVAHERAMVSASFTSDTVIRFQRDRVNDDVTCSYWVVTAVNNEFRVVHDINGAGGTSVTFPIAIAFDERHAMLLHSHETNVGTRRSDESHLDCRVENQSVLCERFAGGGDVDNVAMQLIEFRDTLVTRTTVDIADNETEGGAELPQGLDETMSSPIMSVLGYSGAAKSDCDAADALAQMTTVRFDGGKMAINRNDSGCELSHTYQVVEWK